MRVTESNAEGTLSYPQLPALLSVTLIITVSYPHYSSQKWKRLLLRQAIGPIRLWFPILIISDETFTELN